ncbi:hypothetical protein FX016_14240 [Cupriavidus gilardii]|nr:hypothetical protein FX016_14240 [Cupriavidus gilardii]
MVPPIAGRVGSRASARQSSERNTSGKTQQETRDTMSANLYDAKEPLLRCLQENLAGWHSALDHVLSQSGISPTEWLLLQHLAHRQRTEPDRITAACTLPWLEAEEFEAMVRSLSDQGWLEQQSGPHAAQPIPLIRSSASHRMDKLGQAIKALQSVWVSPLSLEERGMMLTCLTRMRRQLERLAPRGSTNCATNSAANCAASGGSVTRGTSDRRLLIR